MFDLGIAELLVIALVFAVALVCFSRLHRWVAVVQRWHVPEEPVELEPALAATMAALSGGLAVTPRDGRIRLTQRRTPAWTVVLAVLTFPVGLLFLLVKVNETLVVLITPEQGGGSRVDIVGVTRSRSYDALAHALVAERGAGAERVTTRP